VYGTLISGECEAVLVDALMTNEQGQRLSAWVGAKGKALSEVLITHGHGNHFFGATPVLAAFPAAALVAAT
jgi:glyoxylase-like metal-dependent hydrolase (beta-lactamase superfamily II)